MPKRPASLSPLSPTPTQPSPPDTPLPNALVYSFSPPRKDFTPYTAQQSPNPLSASPNLLARSSSQSASSPNMDIFFPCPNPQLALTTKSVTLSDNSSAWAQEITRIFQNTFNIEAAGTGRNGAQFVKMDGQTLAVIKLSEAELGTASSKAITRLCKEEALASNEGIKPGMGAFIEHLCYRVLKRWLKEAGLSASVLSVPDSVWFTTISHPQLSFPAWTENLVATQLALNGSGCINRFMDGCKTFKAIAEAATNPSHPDHALLGKLDTQAVLFLALATCLLLDTDVNSQNLLIQPHPNEQAPTLILIDPACSLPAPVDAGQNLGIKACYMDLPQLNAPLSEKIQEYILGSQIESVLEAEWASCVAENIQEAQELEPIHLALPKIALAFVREAILQGLSVKAISRCFIKTGHYDIPIVAQIFTQLTQHLTQEAAEQELSQKETQALCAAFLLENPEAIQQRCSTFVSGYKANLAAIQEKKPDGLTRSDYRKAFRETNTTIDFAEENAAR